VERSEWSVAHEQHLEFHLELIGSIGLDALSVFLRPMEEIINLSSLPPRGDDPSLWEVDAHRAILVALEAGDPDAMFEAVKQHFDYMRREPYLTLRLTRFRDAVGPDALKAAVQRASA
jgi:DNA-binding GntR family transcriptional regulator